MSTLCFSHSSESLIVHRGRGASIRPLVRPEGVRVGHGSLARGPISSGHMAQAPTAGADSPRISTSACSTLSHAGPGAPRWWHAPQGPRTLPDGRTVDGSAPQHPIRCATPRRAGAPCGRLIGTFRVTSAVRTLVREQREPSLTLVHVAIVPPTRRRLGVPGRVSSTRWAASAAGVPVERGGKSYIGSYSL